MLNNAYCQSPPDTVPPKSNAFSGMMRITGLLCLQHPCFLYTYKQYIVIDLVWSQGDKFPSYVGDKVCCECRLTFCINRNIPKMK